MNPERRISRRNFLKAGVAVLLGPPAVDLALWLPEVQKAWTHVEIRQYAITDHRIEGSYCFVHTSDAHFDAGGKRSAFIDPTAMTNIAEAVNARLDMIKTANPDVTVISVNTGDYVIGTATLNNMPNLDKGVGALTSIRADHHLAVLGNHDNGHGNVDKIIDTLKTHGFSVLDADDRTTTIPINEGDLEIVGTPDYTTKSGLYRNNNQHWQNLFNDGPPKIWLTHNAQIVDKLGFDSIARDNVLLSLHGHTHGGQISTGGLFRPILKAIALHEIGYDSSLIDGMYHTEGEQYWININTGLGNSTGDLQHTRGIAPRVDLITLTAGPTNTFEWKHQDMYEYR